MTVGAGNTEHTLSGLKPETAYYVLIGAQTERFGATDLSWGPWSNAVTTAGQHGAGFCPITGLPLPPGGYLSVGTSTTHAAGQVFTLDSAAKKATISLDGTDYLPFTGRQYFQICGTVQAPSDSAAYFLSGRSYHIDTDTGLGFAFFDDSGTDWIDIGTIPAGETRSACETWNIPSNANTVVIAINNWQANPALYKVDLP